MIAFATLIATALTATALTATAATPVEPKAAPGTAPAATMTLQARPAAESGAQRLCAVDEPVTGSMLKRRTCLTRAEWTARGVTFAN